MAVPGVVRTSTAIALATTWRAHSCSGAGPEPGKFDIEEDDEKITFILNPSGSCGRLWRRGLYGPPKNYGMTKEAHDWSFHRKDFPYYCTHCSFMNESLPIEWTGVPLYPDAGRPWRIAERLGVRQSMVARLESRQPDRMPTFATVARVADVCGYEMEVVLRRKRENHEEERQFEVRSRDFVT